MDGVVLPPDLEQFAAEEVAAGRYRDLDEVVRAGVGLLRQRSQAKAELLASILAAQAEGDSVGYLTADEVAGHVRETIRRRAGTAA